jgi:hydrogenase maturation protein HypF
VSLLGRRIEVQGVVQGVGFRPWVFRVAREVGIRGRVRNHAAGVTIEAFGARTEIEELLRRIAVEPPPAAAVESLEWRPIAGPAPPGFEIVASDPEAEELAGRIVSIPPDLATCPRCAAEIADRGDRRFGYAFTNCTDCGPRYSIARDVPYDRARTTMAGFRMCARCQGEYDAPGDRRFHAQPNACPECGPRLALLSADGAPIDAHDPLAAAARALGAGLIVAIKGLGGYHLACDAGDPAAVVRLRARKRREEKPFAVMVRDAAEAARVAHLSAAEQALLEAIERPIVLLRRRENAGIAAAVAPGSPWLGLFLPYTPLHHLLLAEAARPLVMTSANLSDEPILFRDEEAVRRLAGVADLFLAHDRPIENRCDDSVARVIAGRPVVLRRSRGYVPRPIRLAHAVDRPVLAVGAHLKNAFCLVEGRNAWFGPHVGDLETLAACEAFEEAVPRLERFLGIAPAIVAHDLHPEYFTTRWAERCGLPAVAVQHHHAHAVAAMAEHGRLGPQEAVLALAWDGTGLGTDGAAWGGELLLARLDGFERLATFRPLALPGGDLAVREVWRLALAALDDAFDGAPPLDRLQLFGEIDPRRIALARAMVREGLHAPLAHGVGRWFDALGALGLARPLARYEGQVATAWDAVADPAARQPYPYAIEAGAAPWRVDLRPLVRAAVADLLAGRGAAQIAGRFHSTLAAAACDLVCRARAAVGALPVVATGGCFQNARLAEELVERLGERVLLHGAVPPGDGGLALGQALVADARARRGEATPCV